jgi:hypothetical protein
MGALLVEPDVDAVLSNLDRIRRDTVGVPARWLARQRIVIPPVPRTSEPAVFDRSFAEWAALMRTSIVQRGVLPFMARHAHGLPRAGHGFDPALRELIVVQNPMPDEVGGW